MSERQIAGMIRASAFAVEELQLRSELGRDFA